MAPAWLTEEMLYTYMQMAINVAKPTKRQPYALPKPWVGSMVFSRTGQLKGYAGKGYVDTFLQHAERRALDIACGDNDTVQDGVLFTTLEPCVHVRKNQIFDSCSELIARRGIRTVVFGLIDGGEGYENATQPNGRGVQFLQRRGVEVIQYSEGLELGLEKIAHKYRGPLLKPAKGVCGCVPNVSM